MSSIYDWSTTAATNSSSDSLINWAEGQAPSSVNNSARQLMGRVAELLDDLGGAHSAGGTANALTVTATSAFAAYADGLVVAFRATADNTGAATLSVNSVGAKQIYKNTVIGPSELTGGEIQSTGIYAVRHHAGLNSGAGVWLLEGPNQIASGTWTPVLTCATPGNLSVAYATQIGRWWRDENRVTAYFNVTTSTFTHTTASGNIFLSGLPYTSESTTNLNNVGSTLYSSMYSDTARPQLNPFVQSNSTVVRFAKSGPNVSVATAAITDFVTANTFNVTGSVTYFAA